MKNTTRQRSRVMTCMGIVGLVLYFLAPTVRAQETNAIVVAFELLKTQHMVVKVKVNNKGPFTLVFDTGAPFTLLSNKVGKEAQVFEKGKKPGGFSLFGA